MKKLIILLTIAALVCLTFTAMAAGDGIAFDTSVNAINEGETLQTVLTREGAAAEGEVTYTSSNPKMATVDENGLVTAVLKGRVNITAVVKADKKSYKAQLQLNIIRPVTAVNVNTAKLPVYEAADEKVAPYLTARENADENALPVLLLPVKKRLTLPAAVEPKDASNTALTFTSGDESVFTANKNNITGVAPGEAILTVASVSNPETVTRYRVLVVQPVTKLTIESSAPTVTVGQQVSVTAHAQPDNATMQNVIWSSGDERIITVDANGTVTGVKRGNGRVIATAADGSNIRANYNIKVVQNPESITLPGAELTVDVGRNAPCRATVEPKDADNKKVIWTSSDENIAKVNKNGQITGVSIGDCTVTCTSEALDSVSASITVHVQQPVRKVTFNGKIAYAYVNEGTQLSWTIEPENATNPALEFKSSKEAIAVVDANGIVTGVKGGKTAITAMTTDGSKRKAQITVQVGEHVTGVQMVRRHAYIDVGQTATAGANIEPKDALNKNMTWESSDPSIVTASGNTNHKMKLHGVAYGEAVVTGTTEDGGFQTSIPVTVGNFNDGLSLLSYHTDNAGNLTMTVRNNLSNLTITSITAQMTLWDCRDDVVPAPCNTNGSNTVNVVWNGTLPPGGKTGGSGWRNRNFYTPECGMDFTRGDIKIISYQIEGDWIKDIASGHQPHDYWN